MITDQVGFKNERIGKYMEFFRLEKMTNLG